MSTATERPILFNAEMVRALLDGRKTQTRRPVKPQPPSTSPAGLHGPMMYSPNRIDDDGEFYPGEDVFGLWHEDYWDQPCPYGAPGDVLYVRESFRLPEYADTQSPSEYLAQTNEDHWAVWTEADSFINGASANGGSLDDGSGGWAIKDDFGKLRPSIHMPKALSRIHLRVTDVRVERVQEITIDDSLAEGVEDVDAGADLMHGTSPKDRFRSLWNETYEDQGLGWHANPFVWVIEFERIK